MRTTAVVSFALLGLAAANPLPQDIDFDAYESIPVLEDISAPIGASVVSSAASYNPTAAASSVCLFPPPPQQSLRKSPILIQIVKRMILMFV